MSDTFQQWWHENQALFEKRLSTDGPHILTRRDIAHMAWTSGTVSLSRSVDQAVNKILLENIHEV